MNLSHLCKKSGMPEEVTEEILSLREEMQPIIMPAAKAMLRVILRYSDPLPGLEELKKLLAPDERGIKMLALCLCEALERYEDFQKKGISETIYIDTMRCFSRFVGEHKVSFGVYGFDREWWTVRQLTLRVFRIGALEFETEIINGKKQINIHIPSDSAIEPENCLHSIQMARDFFQQYKPDYAGVPYCCESWLLTPALKDLLPENSRILKFQSLFAIDEVLEDNQEYIEWIFKKPNLTLDAMPEDTSLQKKAKAWLASGKKIGTACGHLIV